MNTQRKIAYATVRLGYEPTFTDPSGACVGGFYIVAESGSTRLYLGLEGVWHEFTYISGLGWVAYFETAQAARESLRAVSSSDNGHLRTDPYVESMEMRYG